MAFIMYFSIFVIGLVLYMTILNKYKVNTFFYICLLLYTCLVFHITLLPVHSFTPLTFQELLLHTNFIPFFQNYQLMDGLEISQCFQNTIMFMPLGILLPLTFKKNMKMNKFIILCFGFSLIIETLQLVLTCQGILMRVFDINDLIFNTLGATFTYGFVCFIGQCLYRQKGQAI